MTQICSRCSEHLSTPHLAAAAVKSARELHHSSSFLFLAPIKRGDCKQREAPQKREDLSTYPGRTSTTRACMPASVRSGVCWLLRLPLKG